MRNTAPQNLAHVPRMIFALAQNIMKGSVMGRYSIIVLCPALRPSRTRAATLKKLSAFANVERAVLRQRAVDDVDDAARARAHHHDLGAQIHSLGDGVGDETDRLFRPPP